MKLVFCVDSESKTEVDGIIDEDPISRLSVTEKDTRALDLDLDGTVFVLDGDDKICQEAKEKLTEVSEELTGDDKEEVLNALEEEEKKSREGFGSIFG